MLLIYYTIIYLCLYSVSQYLYEPHLLYCTTLNEQTTVTVTVPISDENVDNDSMCNNNSNSNDHNVNNSLTTTNTNTVINSPQQPLFTLRATNHHITCLTTICNTTIITAGKDKTIKIWSLLTGKCQYTITDINSIIISLCVITTYKLLCGTDTGELLLIDLLNYTVIQRIQCYEQEQIVKQIIKYIPITHTNDDHSVTVLTQDGSQTIKYFTITNDRINYTEQFDIHCGMNSAIQIHTICCMEGTEIIENENEEEKENDAIEERLSRASSTSSLDSELSTDSITTQTSTTSTTISTVATTSGPRLIILVTDLPYAGHRLLASSLQVYSLHTHQLIQIIGLSKQRLHSLSVINNIQCVVAGWDEQIYLVNIINGEIIVINKKTDAENNTDNDNNSAPSSATNSVTSSPSLHSRTLLNTRHTGAVTFLTLLRADTVLVCTEYGFLKCWSLNTTGESIWQRQLQSTPNITRTRKPFSLNNSSDTKAEPADDLADEDSVYYYPVIAAIM